MDSPTIIVPNGFTEGLILPELPKWSCPFCGATFLEDQERAILRHIDKHSDDMLAYVERKKQEPLNVVDDEQIQWNRRRATERKVKGVKGINGYDGR